MYVRARTFSLPERDLQPRSRRDALPPVCVSFLYCVPDQRQQFVEGCSAHPHVAATGIIFQYCIFRFALHPRKKILTQKSIPGQTVSAVGLELPSGRTFGGGTSFASTRSSTEPSFYAKTCAFATRTSTEACSEKQKT